MEDVVFVADVAQLVQGNVVVLGEVLRVSFLLPSALVGLWRTNFGIKVLARAKLLLRAGRCFLNGDL